MIPVLCLLVLLCILGSLVLLRRPGHDAAHLGASETRMWQAYYGGRRLPLCLELIRQLRAQFGLTIPQAIHTGYLLARSAMHFKRSRNHYEEAALPDLIAAYDRIRQATGRTFDPEPVARAELAWWVARRTPGQKTPEQVGRRIGELYSLFYGNESPHYAEAGILRAEAAHLRYLGHPHPDWPRIQTMLVESYRLLLLGQAAGKPKSDQSDQSDQSDSAQLTSR